MIRRRTEPLAWVMLAITFVYFALPLIAMLWSAITTPRGVVTFVAFTEVVQAPEFGERLLFSAQAGLITIVFSTLLVVPTAYWVNLRLPNLRPVVELITLIPLVIPPILLTFGLIRFFNSTELTNSNQGLYVLLIGAYVVISFPFFYRSIDTGMQAINLRVLTEAAQSLGASWWTIMLRVILPNLIVAILNGSFITFAIVLGEYTVASLLSQPALSPYMLDLNYRQADQATALALIIFGVTWAATGLLSLLGRGGARARSALST